MNLSEQLVQLGFSNNVATVYSALVEHGPCKASAIIKDTGLHRNIVYEALDDLVQRRLAFKTSKGGVAVFQLSDAQSLIADAKEQLTTAEEVAQKINKQREKTANEIKLYEGMAGLAKHREEILEDLKKTKREFQVIASSKVGQELYQDFFVENDKKLNYAGIDTRILFPVTRAEQGREVGKKPRMSTKILPPHMLNPTMVDIWNDNVAFMVQEMEPFIISIKNESLATSFREYFETLWGQDTQVITGLQNVQKLFEGKLASIKKGEEYLVINATSGKGSIHILKPWLTSVHKERIERGVGARILGPSSYFTNMVETMVNAGDPDLHLSSLKTMPQESNSPMSISIYPDSITLYHWDTEENTVAIDIQRKEIHSSMKLYFDSLWSNDTGVYKGKEGIQTIFEEALEHEESWFIGGNAGIVRLMPEYWEEYNTRRIEKGVWWNDLIDSTSYLEHMERIEPGVRNEKQLFWYKRLPKELDAPNVIFMYGDTVVNILWHAEPEGVAFVIRNKDVFNSYRKYFDLLWEMN